MTTVVDHSFLELDSPSAAIRLLGAVVSTNIDGSPVSIEINEVEAYLGSADPASHAYRGRTDRTAPMFEQAGTIYVYRSYGIHWCMNFVTGPLRVAQAVLVRGGVVIDGLDTVQLRRGRSTELTNGPGKLTQALAVTGDDTGTYLGEGRVTLSHVPSEIPPYVSTPRIGISSAKDELLRFVAGST